MIKHLKNIYNEIELPKGDYSITEKVDEWREDTENIILQTGPLGKALYKFEIDDKLYIVFFQNNFDDILELTEISFRTAKGDFITIIGAGPKIMVQVFSRIKFIVEKNYSDKILVYVGAKNKEGEIGLARRDKVYLYFLNKYYPKVIKTLKYFGTSEFKARENVILFSFKKISDSKIKGFFKESSLKKYDKVQEEFDKIVK